MTKRTKKLWIFSTISLLLALGLFVFMLFRINLQEAELHKQVQMLAEYQSQQDVFFNLRKTADESAEERAELQSYYLRDRNDGVEFLTEIEAVAKQFGVSLTAEGVTEHKEASTGSNWFVMDFELGGPENAIVRFISYLEVMPIALRVTKVQFTETEAAADNWKGTLTLQVRILDYAS